MPERRLEGLPPVEAPAARILILGSFPSQRSLQARQYYAHPRNHFWPILGALVGANAELPYDQRLSRLRAADIALWDVLHACRRRGSGDHAIEPGSEEINDLVDFVERHPSLRLVAFNGMKSHAVARRGGLLDRWPARLSVAVLPSTSPANARGGLALKLERWRDVVARCLDPLQLSPAARLPL